MRQDRLPTIKVHFSKDKKDQEFRLDNQNDWEIVKSEWKLEAAKKREGAYGAVILSKEVTCFFPLTWQIKLILSSVHA
ncbi:MAG TPA: hypothetical protein VGO47_10800 [Chlamydiales bacterium]|nr:hypothetical protein [Chlamydiales bacterium]